jgi:hypothetical protein
LDDEALQALLDADSYQTTCELAEQLNCSYAIVDSHLHALGNFYKCGRLLPHQLFTDNLAQRASIGASMLFRQRNQPFLEQIITGGEKWVYYANVHRRRQ